jgi:hypothetical protein
VGQAMEPNLVVYVKFCNYEIGLLPFLVLGEECRGGDVPLLCPQ